MKKLKLIHKEPNEECFEILKSCIVEDKKLKEYRIDKDTLLENLPEGIVNAFLDHLGTDEQHRSLILFLIKNGSLVVHCWGDDENSEDHFKSISENYNRLSRSRLQNTSDYPYDLDIPF